MKVAALGYIGLTVSDPLAWRNFTIDVLGLMASPAAEAGREERYLTEERAWRIGIKQSPADDLSYAGLEVATLTDLEALKQQLKAAGVACEEATPAMTRLREVTRLFTCRDPDGLVLEL